jgi:glycosyltransferase involved in cell wall biosynthesis
VSVTGSPLSIVVPTVGRPSLALLIDALEQQLPAGGWPEVVLVDDRRSADGPLVDPLPTRVRVVAGAAAGPAAARNTGWRAVAGPAAGHWVVFLDDDVVVDAGWWQRLQADLRQPAEVAGVQGRITVPTTADKPATDWEVNTARLAHAPWITADMAYRWSALQAVGGFDERLPRAYREDSDLAYRIRQQAGELVLGSRNTTHPVRPESGWTCLRAQAGNADDALLRRRYGPSWRRRLQLEPGRRSRHAALVAAVGALAIAAGLQRGSARRRTAALAVSVLAAGVTEFAWTRARDAPAELRRPVRLLASSALIPPLAVGHWLAGWWRHREVQPWQR